MGATESEDNLQELITTYVWMKCLLGRRHIDEIELPASDTRKFQETCRSFWITAAKYTIKKLPVESEFLKNVTWLHPGFRDYGNVSQVLLLALNLPQVIREEEKAQLREEFIDYCTVEFPPNCTSGSASDIDIIGAKLVKLKMIVEHSDIHFLPN